MKEKIVIIGAGGHGKVVADAITAQGKYELLGFIDASIPVGKVIVNDFKVIQTQADFYLLKDQVDTFIVAVGSNIIREKLVIMAEAVLKPATVIHPSALIGSDVTIGVGSVVLANTVINSSSKIGRNTIVNTGSIIDHDCIIGNNIHLSIGTLVGSNSEIKDGYTSRIGEAIDSFSTVNKN